jgi:hypothetical protein
MAIRNGTADDDALVGTGRADIFDLTAGGADTADGAGGDDRFNLGAAFDAGDRISGKNGFDTVALDGDYSVGLQVSGQMMRQVELLELAGGHAYDLTLDDGVIGSGQMLSVVADGRVRIDASAETDGRITVVTHAGFDVIGGANEDRVTCQALTASDRFDGGGGGSDEIDLNSGGLYRFTDTTITGVEVMVVTASGSAANVILRDANVAAGENLAAVNLGGAGMRIDGRAERDGTLTLLGSVSFDDTLIGGRGDDRLDCRGGNDILTGGRGADAYDLTAFLGNSNVQVLIRGAADSRFGHGDTIVAADAGDVIDLSMVDADTTTDGNQAFTVVESFSGAAGEAVFSYDDITGVTTLLLETNGVGRTDMELSLRAADGQAHVDYTGFDGFVF